MDFLMFNHFYFKKDSFIRLLPNTELASPVQGWSALCNSCKSFVKHKICINKTKITIDKNSVKPE